MKHTFHSSFLTLTILLSLPGYGQIGIGTTTPHPSSILEVQSESKGFLPPRLTEENRDLIPSPIAGLMIYNTDDACLNFHNGTSWVNPCLQNTGQTISSVLADAQFPANGGNPSLNDLEVIGLVNLTSNQESYEEAIANASPQPTTLEELQTLINNTNNISQFITPSNIILQQTDIFKILSMYDNDYSPFSLPTQLASLNTAIAPATNNGTEALVDIQGVITTSGIPIEIPCVSTGSGILPTFNQNINIPAEYTQDGVARTLLFSWEETNYNATTSSISAILKSNVGPLNIKQLDVQAGIGNDYSGFNIGQINYPYNTNGDIYTLKVNAIAGVPDRMYGIADNTGSTTSHQFIYIPMLAR